MKPVLCTFALLFLTLTISAQTWQPTPGHTQLPIWPGKPPRSTPQTTPSGSETVETTGKDSLVAGKPWVAVSNVSQPTMTVYSPSANNTGAAVVVFPGGGYQILAIDLEGTEACDWLTSKGITCVLLKYRVPDSGPAYHKSCHCQIPAPVPAALQDAQRTLGLLRLHAAEYHVDPHKIGVLGFSAGGHMVAAISTHFSHRIYTPIDAADRQSCRPDFAIALYPGHLSLADNSIALNPDIRTHITKQTPPTFLLQNEDDHVDRVEDSLSYYAALKKAGVPTEIHLYAQGGHAFGLRHTRFPVSDWPKLAETWLTTIGILPAQAFSLVY